MISRCCSRYVYCRPLIRTPLCLLYWFLFFAFFSHWFVLQMYDTDSSGGISLAELESAFKRTNVLYGKKGASRMSGRMAGNELQEIMDMVDVDKNRELDFEEFCTLLGEAFTV